MNLLLLRTQYSPAIITIDEQRKYLGCITQADKGNIGPFIQFIAKALYWTQQTMLDDLLKYSEQPKLLF